MSGLFFCFGIAFLLSFFGTLPLGIISSSVVEHAISKGQRAGVIIALGSVPFEFVYTYVALVGLDLMATNEHLDNYMQIATGLILLILGIIYLLKAPPRQIKSAAKKLNDYRVFCQGMFAGLLSIGIIPFWIFVGLFLKSYDVVMVTWQERFIFSLGSALGAYVVFVGYAIVSKIVVQRFSSVGKWTNRISGSILLGLGAIQFIQLL